MCSGPTTNREIRLIFSYSSGASVYIIICLCARSPSERVSVTRRRQSHRLARFAPQEQRYFLADNNGVFCVKRVQKLFFNPSVCFVFIL